MPDDSIIDEKTVLYIDLESLEILRFRDWLLNISICIES